MTRTGSGQIEPRGNRNNVPPVVAPQLPSTTNSADSGQIEPASRITRQFGEIQNLEPQTVSALSQLDDAALASLSGSLEVVPLELKGAYLKIIASDVVKGQALVAFRTFETPERFSNVFNAIDSVGDVAIVERVFDENNLDLLSSDMRTRYEELLEEVASTGRVPPPPQNLQDLVQNQTFSERLEVLEQAIQTKRTLENQLTSEVYHDRKYQLGGRNMAFGSIELNLPDGQQINEEVVSISGKRFPQEINGKSPEHQIDNRRVVPSPGKGDDRLPVTERRRGGHQDSERKLAYYILKQIEARTGINVDPSNLAEGESYSGFTGKITISSEMSPCTSCAKILTKQLDRLFGEGNIRVEVKYGVVYQENISDTIR